MSDYTITTDFGAKDALNTGDAGKVIKGAEFTTEFEAIKTAVNSKADTASPTFTGTVTVPGLTTTADVSFGDNDKATFGAGNDLQIYHDGSHSYVEDASTGNFRFKTNGNGFFFEDSSGNSFITTLTATGSARLHYSNDIKLTTGPNGIDVTGDTSTDTLTIDGTQVTATAAELNHTDGVTSNIQTQLDAKVSDSDFTESFVSNGWTELPNGLIIQWGRTSISGNGSNVSVSFPKAFTTACLQVVISAEDNGTSISHNVSLGTTAPTTTTFRITNGVDDTRNIRFIAIGH